MDLSAFVGKLLEEQEGAVLREGIRVLSQALMETEVAGLIGAERHERTGERTAYRNGSRTRTWDTRMGTIELAIPKVRPGTYFPSLLQPRRRAEHALLGVVQEACVHGVSTRKVDDLMKALGLDGISKSEVSRMCGELDTVVAAFRTRPLTGEHRYLWVDAPYLQVRVDGRVISQATVAVGITAEGDRQVLGVDVGPSEDRAFWTAFLRSLVKRGLKGVRRVISDAHEGLKQAIRTVLSGSSWQRCRVHFMRHLLATVPQGARDRGDRPHHLCAARSRLGDEPIANSRRRPAHALPARGHGARRPPKTSWRPDICRSTISGNCTAPTRSNA
jgi:transposase-like protein